MYYRSLEMILKCSIDETHAVISFDSFFLQFIISHADYQNKKKRKFLKFKLFQSLVTQANNFDPDRDFGVFGFCKTVNSTLRALEFGTSFRVSPTIVHASR